MEILTKEDVELFSVLYFLEFFRELNLNMSDRFDKGTCVFVIKKTDDGKVIEPNVTKEEIYKLMHVLNNGFYPSLEHGALAVGKLREEGYEIYSNIPFDSNFPYPLFPILAN